MIFPVVTFARADHCAMHNLTSPLAGILSSTANTLAFSPILVTVSAAGEPSVSPITLRITINLQPATGKFDVGSPTAAALPVLAISQGSIALPVRLSSADDQLAYRLELSYPATAFTFATLDLGVYHGTMYALPSCLLAPSFTYFRLLSPALACSYLGLGC